MMRLKQQTTNSKIEHDYGSDADFGILDIIDPVKLEPPSHYRVIMKNDDFTPMDFVIEMLCEIFDKDIANATTIMLDIHEQGRGICGIYSKEIAETKCLLTTTIARDQGYPLACVYEKNT